MIIDNIKNLDKYILLNKYKDQITAFINKSKEEGLGEGKYSLENDNLYVLIQEYETKPKKDCTFESHIKYLDLQYIEKGNEIIRWIDVDELVQSNYNLERDMLLYNDLDKGLEIGRAHV